MAANPEKNTDRFFDNFIISGVILCLPINKEEKVAQLKLPPALNRESDFTPALNFDRNPKISFRNSIKLAAGARKN